MDTDADPPVAAAPVVAWPAVPPAAPAVPPPALPPPTGPLASALVEHGAVVVVVLVVAVDFAPDLDGFVVVVAAGFVVVVVVADEHGAPLEPSAWAPVPTPPVRTTSPSPQRELVHSKLGGALAMRCARAQRFATRDARIAGSAARGKILSRVDQSRPMLNSVRQRSGRSWR